MRSLNGFAHSTVVVQDANRSNRLTVILFHKKQRFHPLSEYFAERNFSLESERVYSRALGYLIDFITAFAGDFSAPHEKAEFFNQFAHALKYGTVQYGDDPSCLWWLPRASSTVNQILGAAVELSDWLVAKANATPINPWRKASIAEEIIRWRKWSKLSAGSLLRHLKTNEAGARYVRDARKFASPAIRLNVEDLPPPAFPDELFVRLLKEGFIRPGKSHSSRVDERHNLRDIMVALLMNGGGLRISEAFHVYATDVYARPEDPSVAFVKVFHPSDGAIEVQTLEGRKTMNRAAYLRVFHDKLPLNQIGKRTGWKNNLVNPDGLYMPVHWFPKHYGVLFLKLFERYLRMSRPYSSSPWLFLTEAGMPMTAKAYAGQHDAAVRRLGIQPRKADGTSPHGHRHAYGQRLEAARKQGLITEKILQLCLHHRSAMAQRVYTQDASAEITKILNAANRMINADVNYLANLLED